MSINNAKLHFIVLVLLAGSTFLFFSIEPKEPHQPEEAIQSNSQVLSGSEPALRNSASCHSLNDAEGLIKQTELMFGAKIHYEFNADVIPRLYQISPSYAKITPVKTTQVCRMVAILSTEIQKYSEQIIRQHVKHIYLADSLSFQNVPYGGTAIGDSLYLTVGDEELGYSAEYLSELFHHEISSVFFNAYEFPQNLWRKINHPDFSYIESDTEVLKVVEKGNLDVASETTYQAGFLSEYGKTNVENDFNTYAEMLMVHPKKLELLANKYSKVHDKYVLLIKFYRQVVKT